MTVTTKGTSGEYELVILRPSHFLVDNFPVVIKHPITQNFTCFYASDSKDGYLCEGSPIGLPLPPFRSRGVREIPLNPILVNYAANVRLRRLIRGDPAWGSALDSHVIRVLKRVIALHAAVIWDPQGTRKTQLLFKAPGSPTVYDLEKWPYDHTSTAAAEPGSSSLGAAPGINAGALTLADRYMDLIEARRFPTPRSLDWTTF